MFLNWNPVIDLLGVLVVDGRVDDKDDGNDRCVTSSSVERLADGLCKTSLPTALLLLRFSKDSSLNIELDNACKLSGSPNDGMLELSTIILYPFLFLSRLLFLPLCLADLPDVGVWSILFPGIVDITCKQCKLFGSCYHALFCFLCSLCLPKVFTFLVASNSSLLALCCFHTVCVFSRESLSSRRALLFQHSIENTGRNGLFVTVSFFKLIKSFCTKTFGLQRSLSKAKEVQKNYRKCKLVPHLNYKIVKQVYNILDN